jgi:hypothetical protein
MDGSTLRIENDLRVCVDSCLQCLVACELCATACLERADSKAMTRCIQLALICADLCALTAREITRRSDLMLEVCALCVLASRSCGSECARHSDTDHCKRCATACRRCEKDLKYLTAFVRLTFYTVDVDGSYGSI